MRLNKKHSPIIVLFLLSLLVACTEDTAPPGEGSGEKGSEVTGQGEPGKGPSHTDPSEGMGQGPREVDKANPNWKQNLGKPEVMSFEDGKHYFWDMRTNKGDMSFELYHHSAPMHVSSTIYLTELGFYDSVVFHRVITGFMAQGGDPTGTGSGGPGYSYDGEFSAGISHDKRGLLSMANSGPGTDGSQFFITFVPTEYLDGKHTIFGELTSGDETLLALEDNGSNSGRTGEKLQIIEATIRVE